MKQNQVILAIFLLLGVSSIPLLTQSSFSDELTVSSFEKFSEEERLEIATEHWFDMSGEVFKEVTLKPLSGNLHLAHGIFDPTVDEQPDLPENLVDHFDYLETGLVFVQLESSNSQWLSNSAEEMNIRVIDNLGDGNFIVRLGPNVAQSFENLADNPLVRWAGNINPGYRVHPNLIWDDSYSQFSIIPTSDLDPVGYEELVLSLVDYGAYDAWCGMTTCQATVTESSKFIDTISRDGRVLWIEPVGEMVLHNAVARAITGVANIEAGGTFTLDGSGEMLAITDTGLDRDHPDLNGRVAAIYTQFGLDTSPADTNGGHGTHVTLTAVGNGLSDSTTTGIAPEADVTMYALEHDPTGVFGRQGSIYDMLLDAKQKTARIAINAWGLNGNYGEYTADSRSVDQFVHDEPSLLPVFSVGDRGGQGSSQVSAPSTAKNVLSVGVSTTGSSGSTAQGSVDTVSSEGPTLDGRIKPDVVAPGIEICSGRAEEAKSPSGFACGTGTHSNGDPLYMLLSGTSQSTAVAGGLASLTREFLREEIGIPSPSASLIKAAMINGAIDLGTPDVPNNVEGWGQLNLENTVMPMDGTVVLSNYYDYGKMLQPSFGLSYEFDMDMSHGVDITLAWNDDAGSANSAQSSPKLVNDLDLILISPNGDTWLGNQFASGVSVQGGNADSVNNVERISIPSGQSSLTGQWLVQVMHRGGNDQDFSIVVSGDATVVSRPDVTTFADSIYLSSPSPLKDDIVSIRVSWVNQGTADSGGFHWVLEDMTENIILLEGDSQGVSSSVIESKITTRSFSTTGIHTLRLSLDTTNQLDEMNDESSGTNNNIFIKDIEVAALGIRVVALNDDGSIPVSEQDKQLAASKNFDVKNDTGIDIPISIINEGTSTESITLSYTNIQEMHPVFNYFIPPEDTWTKSVSQNSPYSLAPQGNSGDKIELVLHFENENADLSDPNSPRYARAGTFYSDVTVAYQSNPTVSHSMRLTIVIGELDDVVIVVSGTTDLAAKPGESAVFAISALNTGNSQAQYSVECFSDSLWQIMLGNSNSSSLDFEPLDIATYLSMPVRIFVPPVSQGLPGAGYQDTVQCFVTSVTDTTLNYSKSVTVNVLEIYEYTTNLVKDGLDVGTNVQVRDILVDNNEEITLQYEVLNLGNSPISMDVIVTPSDLSWNLKIISESMIYSNEVGISILAGQSKFVDIVIVSPFSALEGDFNSLVIKAEVANFDYVINETRLVIKEELSIELESPEDIICQIGDGYSYAEFNVTNTGNSIAELDWSFSLPDDDWVAGFVNPVLQLEPRDSAVVKLGLIAPLNQPVVDSAFKISVLVIAENNNRTFEQSAILDVVVIESEYGNISLEGENKKPFLGVSKGESESTSIILRNDGNVPLSGELTIEVLDSNGVLVSGWNPVVEPSSITSLNPEDSIAIKITIKPSSSAGDDIYEVVVNLSSDGEVVSSFSIQSSASPAEGNSGLFNDVPWYVSLIIISVIWILGLFVATKIRSSGSVDDDGTQLVIADAYNESADTISRRERVLDIGKSQNDLTSGEVSQDEISAALMQSMSDDLAQPIPVIPAVKTIPSLPPLSVQPSTNQPNILPLPATGLPPGWSIEQWNAYGHMWVEQNQK